MEELTISSHYELHGDRLFIVKDNCLESIVLPTSIKKVNSKEIELQQLSIYTIPSNVIKLSDYCFANCQELTEIQGLEQIKEYGIGCFMNCTKLKREQYPQVKQNIEHHLNSLLKEKEQKQLEEWTGLKIGEIIFDSNIDDWKQNTSVLNEQIIGKKQLLFLVEDNEGEIFGYYLNSEIFKNVEYKKWMKTDTKTFHFNLYSQGRLNGSKRFDIKNINKYSK